MFDRKSPIIRIKIEAECTQTKWANTVLATKS